MISCVLEFLPSSLQVVLERTGICSSDGMQLPANELYQHTLAHFELWLLLERCCSITADTCTAAAINSSMQMLQSVACKAAAIAEDGHGVAHFEMICSTAQESLQSASAKRAEHAAKQLTLPGTATAIEEELGQCRLPEGAMPLEPVPSHQAQSLQAARQRAAENLG